MLNICVCKINRKASVVDVILLNKRCIVSKELIRAEILKKVMRVNETHD